MLPENFALVGLSSGLYPDEVPFGTRVVLMHGELDPFLRVGCLLDWSLRFRWMGR